MIDLKTPCSHTHTHRTAGIYHHTLQIIRNVFYMCTWSSLRLEKQGNLIFFLTLYQLHHYPAVCLFFIDRSEHINNNKRDAILLRVSGPEAFPAAPFLNHRSVKTK